jgi:hypothetical protein
MPMLDRFRTIARHRYAPVAIWVIAVTLALAWPIAFPHVEPRGVTVREDTTSFTMLDMSGENYAAILGAVETGRLVMSEMHGGFKLFTRGSLSKLALSRRIYTGNRVIDQYIAQERAAARPPLVAIWAALALVLPGLYLGGRALSMRRPQPLTAPPVKPEMM